MSAGLDRMEARANNALRGTPERVSIREMARLVLEVLEGKR